MFTLYVAFQRLTLTAIMLLFWIALFVGFVASLFLVL